MATFFLRTTKANGKASLYVKVSKPSIKVQWMINTGIEVDIISWHKAESSAKELTRYYATDAGKAVQKQISLADGIIKKYLSEMTATTANKKELESKLYSVIHLDAVKAEEEINQRIIAEKKVKADQEQHKLGEVLNYYESFFAGIQNGSVRHGDNKRYSESSISAWRTFGKHLSGFLKANGIEALHFNDITKRTATAFVTYLEGEELMKATVGQQINHFRSLCNMAAEDGRNSNAVSLRVWKSHEQKDSDKRAEIALTDFEIDALYNLKLSGYAEKCRDVWMMGYFSAQRVSDYSKFSRDNFSINPDGTPVIRVRQQKTDNELEIPILDDRVFEICEKYNYKFPALKRDAINRGIKAACKILSESVSSFKDWEVTLLAAKERDKERWFIEARKRIAAGEKLHGEDSKRYKRCLEYATEHESGDYLYKRDYKGDVIRQRWELVSCHTTRRSMITNLHRTGLFSDREIMSVSGHSTIGSYERYMKVKKTERATSIYEKMKKAKEVNFKKEA